MLSQKSLANHQPHLHQDRALLLQHYDTIRRQTQQLAEGLSSEDLSAQSMPDASPGKWHLAHTTWFFETFILLKHFEPYTEFHPTFNFLFNSYYENVGTRHARPQRGLLTRPSLQEVLLYREYVDGAMRQLILRGDEEVIPLVIIGLHHEMQHQELFLTDLLHLFSHNPLNPAVLPAQSLSESANDSSTSASRLEFVSIDGGLIQAGHSPSTNALWNEFSYDCEQPRHQTYVAPFALASRLITNAEWLEFIEDGAYDNALLWLSDGWAVKQKEQWQAPLYWHQQDGEWWRFALDGYRRVNMNAPVTHVSFYEAEAFARWTGKRLPREHEWECAAAATPISGNFLEAYQWMPKACAPDTSPTATRPTNSPVNKSVQRGLQQLYGDVWEWTQSPFIPYPGFEAKQGALGEYNGKFMANQFVLKGGSCVTPKLQMRSSYRNFFYPHQRWQFTGVRLAQDI